MKNKDKLERYKSIAWSIAASIASATGGDCVLIYNRLINRAKQEMSSQIMSQIKSNKT